LRGGNVGCSRPAASAVPPSRSDPNREWPLRQPPSWSARAGSPSRERAPPAPLRYLRWGVQQRHLCGRTRRSTRWRQRHRHPALNGRQDDEDYRSSAVLDVVSAAGHRNDLVAQKRSTPYDRNPIPGKRAGGRRPADRRTSDLRSTRTTVRIPGRSTSTESTTPSTAGTRRPGRTRSVMPELMPATGRAIGYRGVVWGPPRPRRSAAAQRGRRSQRAASRSSAIMAASSSAVRRCS
jgi:hypothetical protein